jgi:peptidoglycan hydrolase-like protein with peptidoglycan-binding domain
MRKKLPSRFGAQQQRFPHGQYGPQPAGWPFAFAYPSPTPDGGLAPVSSTQGSEYIRWIQDSLNRIADAQLPVDGVMTPDVRNAISTFQQQSGLPVSGIAGPDTERALLDAVRANQPR